MSLNFWPFSVINGLRAKVDRQQQDIASMEQHLTRSQEVVGEYSKRIVLLSSELTELESRFATGKDAAVGSYLIGGYSPKKYGEELYLAVGREVVKSQQLVVFPVPEEDQTIPIEQKYMFRLNAQRTK